MGWGRAAASHPTPWPDILFCSSWTGDLIKRRRRKGVKPAHGRLGGDMEEGARPANKDLAKCSHYLSCGPSVGQGRGCAGAMLLLWPPTPSPLRLSFRSSYLTVSKPFSSAQSSQRSLGANQSGFLAKPLVLLLPPTPTHTHQAWCHQQYFQKEGSEILFFLFFAHLRHAWN